MNELIIIKYFLNKDIYKKYNIYINKEVLKSNYIYLYNIYNILKKLHEENLESSSFTVDDLRAYFFAQYPALRKHEVEIYETLFHRIREIDLTQSVLETVLETHRKRSEAFRLAQIGLDVSEGRRELVELYKAFSEVKDDYRPAPEEIRYVTSDLGELYEYTYAKPGLRWKLKTLRKMMGSLRKGDFGFIFTRPEVGKTTLLADQGSYFAQQMDTPLIHFSNEEAGEKIQIRYYQGALGLTLPELFSDIKGNQKKYRELTKGNIKIYDSPSIEKNQIEDICAKENPGLIVIDSIDKIKGFVDDRDDLVYKQIYAWARELAKQFGPVIGVCHASVSAEGKRWLEMDDVAYAKTAKQGEADWILGIGKTHDPGFENIRHLHLPKNKLLGDEDMEEDLRHAKIDVRIYPEIAQYDDILDWDDNS